MNEKSFTFWDILILVVYAITILSIGLWVSRSKKGHQKNAEDYFLASKALPWWAIGASLIAANISAEQFIGMSGSGFAIGLAIASYEWMAALTLIIVGKFFLPIFIEKGIYTIPEFVEKRYSTNMKTILAIFWIGLYIFVNLTSVLFLGSKALDTILGSGNGDIIIPCMAILALFAAAYSLWGGLSAVAWTDVIQVVLLLVGGLITTFIALSHVPEAEGVIDGFVKIMEKIPEKFQMILGKGEIMMQNYVTPEHAEAASKPFTSDAWELLPGLAILVGGMWVANLYYWGFNQYIIQRTLAAKSLKESQRGIVFAGYLKLLLPLIIVIPGMVAYVIATNDGLLSVNDWTASPFIREDGAFNPDAAYPWLISKFVPVGLKGLVVAALAAAIVSSLASMINSTSTIFTMDIYKPYINKKASDKQTVNVGRITAAVALLIACLIAPLLGSVNQVFQYIQEYTGLVSPGILAVFLLGLFWKKTTNNAAIWGAILSIFIALFLKVCPGWGICPQLPFMHQMFFTTLLSLIIIVIISLVEGKGKNDAKGIPVSRKLFATDPAFNIGAFGICIILVVLYAVFW
ncbi:MAG: sodium/sugar symporter [Prevotellaceae bacterium]|jgi:SSS family solute:Na+ symporter|nr:sodium/sugar symporter [Prevotellaceae bacterium]